MSMKEFMAEKNKKYSGIAGALLLCAGSVGIGMAINTYQMRDVCRENMAALQRTYDATDVQQNHLIGILSRSTATAADAAVDAGRQAIENSKNKDPNDKDKQ